MKALALSTFLASAPLLSPALAQGTGSERDACEADAFKWCAYDIPDVDAIEAHLSRNVRWISPPCQAQMSYHPRRG